MGTLNEVRSFTRRDREADEVSGVVVEVRWDDEGVVAKWLRCGVVE